ncbi:MAG: hypothetical protein QM755_03040 [Luteolibacter sp.]
MEKSFLLDKRNNLIARLGELEFLEEKKAYWGRLDKTSIPPKLKKELLEYRERVLGNSLAYLPQIQNRIDRWKLRVIFPDGTGREIDDITLEESGIFFKAKEDVRL